ncbi:hypothetical protein ACFPOI_41250 [Nonomuraea angiospora]|uniref:DUF4157 domain-containing protein n=1 Tax=Nonomuraea angiospora TaxID=46172 RepID=A0ABR9M4W4_9ACTN|nr:hypothetical protein [Nonomuraea angiospora]MBE1587578.1 hypothetical protein [Nonomuraea angiospora]MDX3110352.1 hypothetical protein [Nonomuraea angiospora]
MNRRFRFRRVANYVNLATPLGLLISIIGGATRNPGPDGLILAFGYRYRFPVAGAFTVGNVVLTRWDALPDHLVRHEGRHATQWAWCVGLPMLPLYLLSMLVSVMVCGNQATYNLFERLADLEDGGYPRAPLWWRRRRGGE